jgi:hypothetical protein
MPVTTVPRFDLNFSISIDDASRELVYILYGSEEEADILAALDAEVPDNVGALFLQSMPVQHLGGGVWEAKAKYGVIDRAQQEPQAEGEADAGTYSFSTGGGTQHIQHSRKATVYKPGGSSGTVLANGTLIGQTKDRVEGVDVIVPVFNWTEGRVFDASVVTQAYKITLMNMTGSTNNAPFRGTAAGETIFKGADGKQDKIDKVEITFSFAASPNRTDLSFGNLEDAALITGVAKKGWEYLDIIYHDKIHSTENIMMKSPLRVIVHQVSPEAMFTDLKIGS